jgi:alanine-synthesizing transaminase
MFSERTLWPQEVNELTVLCQERRRTGARILDLTESNPTRCGFNYPAERLLQALNSPHVLGYAPDPHGPVSARNAVVDYYAERGLALHPDQIFLTSSTSEAYSFIFRLLGNAGDSLLAPKPSYPLFEYLARLNDLDLRRYPMVYGACWRIDLESLKRSIEPRSRAVLVVHPNNPTGSFASDDEREFLVESCRSHHLALIVDEVFSDYWVVSKRPKTFAGEARTLVFTLNGLSKSSALPQMKCSWIVVSGPPELTREAQSRIEIITDTYLSVSAPIYAALPELLALRRILQPQVLKRLRSNLVCLDEQLRESSRVTRYCVDGGWYSILRLPTVRSDEEWALRLLREHGVLVHPGYFYDFSDEGHLVISLLPPPEVFEPAIAKLLACVADGA